MYLKQMTEHQIKTWRRELLQDNPTCDPYFINLVLDLYKNDPYYIKGLSKRKFKPIVIQVPKEIVGAISIVPATDEKFRKKYFQEPLTLTADDEDKV
jgi:hypothetical protein